MADSRAIALAVWAASILSSHAASANDESYPAIDGRTGHEVEKTPPEGRWYGEQILLIDVPSTAAFIGGAAALEPNLI